MGFGSIFVSSVCLVGGIAGLCLDVWMVFHCRVVARFIRYWDEKWKKSIGYPDVLIQAAIILDPTLVFLIILGVFIGSIVLIVEHGLPAWYMLSNIFTTNAK